MMRPMSSRTRAMDMLTALALPLAPEESIQDRDARRVQWLLDSGPDLFDVLLDLLILPPTPGELFPATREDVEGEISEAIGALGRQDPVASLDRIARLLVDANVRPAAIDAIAALGDTGGIPILRSLLGSRTLSDDELVRVAGALGEIGGRDAQDVLREMQILVPPDRDDVMQEIEIALRAAERTS
jgi:HEAT repeat protein